MLVIQGEVDDFDTVMAQLRADYAADADAAKDCDPGFVAPTSVPATCGEEAAGDNDEHGRRKNVSLGSCGGRAPAW